MAQVISTEEMFFTAFEPKTANRFIMYMDGVPAYLIKSVTRPNLTIDVQTMDHIVRVTVQQTRTTPGLE